MLTPIIIKKPDTDQLNAAPPLEARKPTIGFVGTFDVANYGDCLFPIVYAQMIEDELGACDFSYYSPFAQAAPIHDYGPIKPLPDTLRSVAFQEDVLILCGGETLDLGHSSGTFNFPASKLSANARLWFAPTVAASRGEIVFYVHSVGMPPADAAPRPDIEKALLSATKVSVRDEVTARRLGNSFPVEVDPVFALSTMKSIEMWEEEARQWLPDHYSKASYLSAHISAPYLETADLRAWCDQIAGISRQFDLPVMLVPVCHFMNDRMTLGAARDILISLGIDEQRVALAPEGSANVIATAALIGQSVGLVTSSLHASVTAASFGLPFASFTGRGKAVGKHRQTLLAAGIDYGIATSISDLSSTFVHASKEDTLAARDEAIARARRGFQPLLRALRNPTPRVMPMADETIAAVLVADREKTKDWRFEAKRLILRILGRSRLAGRLLAARRRNRILSGLQRA